MTGRGLSLSARLRRDDGITLAELVIAMAILSVVMLVFTSTLASMQRAIVEQDVRSQLGDSARIMLQSIDRQVRSGNLLYDPSAEAGHRGSLRRDRIRLPVPCLHPGAVRRGRGPALRRVVRR